MSTHTHAKRVFWLQMLTTTSDSPILRLSVLYTRVRIDVAGNIVTSANYTPAQNCETLSHHETIEQ